MINFKIKLINQHMIKDTHRCIHCGKNKNSAEFSVVTRPKYFYISKLCRICNNINEKSDIYVAKAKRRNLIKREFEDYFNGKN